MVGGLGEQQKAESLGQSAIEDHGRALRDRAKALGQDGEAGAELSTSLPGGTAHPVQAQGKVEFSHPSPVFQPNPPLSLYFVYILPYLGMRTLAVSANEHFLPCG